MANRFIKSSIWTSENLNRLTADGELLFYRLLPVPDDHGCFQADPRVIRGLCFPKKMEPGTGVTDVWDLPRVVLATVDIICNQLISSWVYDDRLYGIFLEWAAHQQIRSTYRRKTPKPPIGIDDIVKSGQIGRVGKFLDDIVISCDQFISPDTSLPSSLLSSHFSLPPPLLSAEADQGENQPPVQKVKPVTKRPKKQPTGDPPKDNDLQRTIRYFCEQYEHPDNYDFPYRYQGKIVETKQPDGQIFKTYCGGKDGKVMSELLKAWSDAEKDPTGINSVKLLIDTLFESTDQFYEKGGGRTIGVLSACANKLAQEAQRKHQGQDQLSPAGEATARAAARLLEEDECEATTRRLSSPK